MWVSIPDTLHHRVALTGHSGRPGNTLIVSHTSAIYTTLPAVSVFITSIALRGQTRRGKENRTAPMIARQTIRALRVKKKVKH